MTYADVRSILVLGDSVSKGVVLNPEKKRYVFYKEGFIKQLTQKIKPSVFDFSKFGSTTNYGMDLLQQKMTELDPDLVLIEYGSNDCDYNWEEVAQDPYATHLPNLSLRQYIENVTQMVNAIRGKGRIPILTNLHPLDGQRYFNWFTKNEPERQKSTLLWLQQVNRIYWWQEMYSYALERTAAALGVFVVNIRNAFLKQKDYKQYLCEDGIHPNEMGHSLMQQTFMDTITQSRAAVLCK
ncbi:SGNH/GDSL hydrolase family protein [Christensenellaceae bacterium OttesenSCG-928-K19]|nr:SGNH/GDSL hydrolase family protein [Christensenellaceae bacterium OttesenSCG-928-K19]